MTPGLLRPVAAACVLASFWLYHVLNVPRSRVRAFVTAFDRATPFLPAFSVPYLLYFPFLFSTVIYGILWSPYWRQIAFSMLVIQAVASLFYYFFQTHVPRPKLAGADVFTRLVAFIYATDRPYNTLPSLHVAYALACAYWWSAMAPAASLPAGLLAALIVMSTVFIKQHVILDAFAGALLAAAAITLAGAAIPS